MSPTLSIVLGFRDRDLLRVERCLDSLAAQTYADFEVLFVDYGSRAEVAERARRLVSGYGFARHLYSETRGHPWNRSQALNAGLRRSTGAFVMTTDADMVFASDFLARASTLWADDRVLYCRHHYLPRGFDDWGALESYAGRLPMAERTGFGACQVAPAATLRELRGFDEFYRYWGVEDRDLATRLEAAGLAFRWIDDEADMFHQWHPAADVKTAGFFPAGLWGRMERHWLEHRAELVRNDDRWGRLWTAEERPVFAHLDADAGTLVRGPALHRVDPRPYDQRSVGRVLRAFWELPAGHALAVGGAGRPRRHRSLDLALGAANRLLRAVASGSEVGYRFNAVHTFLAELVHRPPAVMADYYLELPADGGVTVLLRGEESA